MDRKAAKNGLDLIKLASIKLRGNFSALFVGTFAMVTPLALIVLVPLIFAMLVEKIWIMTIGILVFMVVVGPMQIGYIKYFNQVMDGEQPRISVIYSEFKFSFMTLRTMYITSLLFLMYIVGGALWIIPAAFAIAFFSMTLFFLEKYKYPRLSMAMTDCAKRMIGNRLFMFSYKLIFYMVYLFAFIICGLSLGLVNVLVADSLIVGWLVAVCSVIVFIFIYSMITVYYHSANQIFFEDILIREEIKAERKRLAKQTVENHVEADINVDERKTETEQKEEKPVEKNDEPEVVKQENAPVEENAQVEKKTTNKSTQTKKTPAKKTTGTKKKTTTKKSTSKKSTSGTKKRTTSSKK